MMVQQTLTTDRGRTLHLAGGILGLAEEADRTAAFLRDHPVDRVLLGIPFEDLDAIRATRERPSLEHFDHDEVDDVYLQQLGRFGATRVPPGDLYAAYEYAAEHEVPVDAIDLGDEGHSTTWTEHVGFFELVRNNRRLRRIGRIDFHAGDAQAFAKEWDEAIFPTKGLRRVQEERETWMARRIGQLTADAKTAFALVPLARWAGIRDALTSSGTYRARA